MNINSAAILETLLIFYNIKTNVIIIGVFPTLKIFLQKYWVVAIKKLNLPSTGPYHSPSMYPTGLGFGQYTGREKIQLITKFDLWNQFAIVQPTIWISNYIGINIRKSTPRLIHILFNRLSSSNHWIRWTMFT